VSKERQKARAAREAARRVEVEAAARRRARAARRKARVPSLTVPRRRRRYGALTARQRFQVVAAFVGVQAVAWLLFDAARIRISVAVLTVAVLLVLVTTRRSTPR
jgi:Flp pilus assembly protein TadB